VLTLIQTCKLNNVGPQAWLADVLGRIADTDLAAPLPWNWSRVPGVGYAA
jgi:transposase